MNEYFESLETPTFIGGMLRVSTSPVVYDPEVLEVCDVPFSLVGPYTYSDMTGFALSHAGGPAG